MLLVALYSKAYSKWLQTALHREIICSTGICFEHSGHRRWGCHQQNRRDTWPSTGLKLKSKPVSLAVWGVISQRYCSTIKITVPVRILKVEQKITSKTEGGKKKKKELSWVENKIKIIPVVGRLILNSILSGWLPVAWPVLRQIQHDFIYCSKLALRMSTHFHESHGSACPSGMKWYACYSGIRRCWNPMN